MALVAGVTVAIRAADGDYSGAYRLVGMFSRAGEGLAPGSQITYRGVQVGRVSGATLSGGHARLVMLIDPGFRVPRDAVATIAPQNIFGADQVDLSFPAGDHGPWLRHGGTVLATRVQGQILDLFAAADPLLERIDTGALSSVVSELAQASSGDGPQIARSISAGAKLASLLDQTVSSQISFLDSFDALSAQVAGVGPTLDNLSNQSNVFLPSFNDAAASYAKVLASFTPFANDFASLLADYRPNFVQLLNEGEDVVAVLVASRPQIAGALEGLDNYVYKIEHGVSSETLPDGSHFSYFNTFIMFSDVNNLVCSLLAPNQPGMAFLEPLQQALTGSGSPFNCSTELARFDAAQAGSSSTRAAPAPAAKPAPKPSGTSVTSLLPPAVSGAARKLLQAVDQILGAPTSAKQRSIGSYVHMLLGGL